MARLICLVVCVGLATNAIADAPAQPVTAAEARKRLGETVWVEMTVQAAKNRLEKRGEIYLDSQPNFRDETNLAAVITRAGAAAYANQGIADPAEHFRDKKIRVRGKVTEVDGVRRIEITDPAQIELVKE